MLATRSLTGPQEGLDHFILLPDCVLAMDSAQLKRDLAGLQFSLHLLSDGPSGSVWLSGATPADQKQNGRPSTAKQGSTASASTSGLWFSDDLGLEGKEGTQVDREERLRLLREKQNDERQRKLEELKQQALAAQKFREQKEEERRRRMEELRMRDTDRRHQVEERKRQIWEAERDRREAILRKNQEREARIESKRKNERSQIVFAFGSSTPRMLEPGETSPYWATRRATSTTNVMTLSLSATPGPLTRRSSERELDGSKKRATSAGGIERKPQHDPLRMTSSSVYEVFHWGLSPTTTERSFNRDDDTDSPMGATTWRKDAARRKTDLTPTLPASKDPGIRTPPSGKKCSPGRAYSMSRLDILASPRRPKLPQPHAPISKGIEVYRSMSVLPGSDKAPKNSMKGAKSMLHLSPTPPPRATRAERLRKKAREMAQKSPEASGVRSGELTPSRPQSSMSQHSITSNLSSASASLRNRSAMTPRRPRPVSIAVTGVTSDKSLDRIKSPGVGGTDKPPIPKVHSSKKPLTSKVETPPKKMSEKPKSTKSSASTTPKSTTPLQSPIVEVEGTHMPTTLTSSTLSEQLVKVEDNKTEVITNTKEVVETETKAELIELKKNDNEEKVQQAHSTQPEPQAPSQPEVVSVPQDLVKQPPKEAEKASENNDLAEADMTASMNAKVRITTEEAAKAALAERRRQAREQAEREAELERQRLEAERLAEEERLRKEEEEQKRMEEEQLRLLEEARKAEELRLQQAIEEARKRDEEEKKRKEEELKLKLEKEEADKKAKEEAEKLRIEMELRLKKEEEDRQARRKRVEAIMLRTRGKGSMTSNTASSKDGEDEDNSPPEDGKKSPEGVGSETNQFINSERSHTDANTTNSQQNNRHNGHHLNGSYNSVAQNNVANSLIVNLGEERVGQILDLENGGSGKLPSEQPQFIPQFQEKKEPHTVNDLLS
ncbi:MAP7 domain-containing protein 1-like isoform X5 [Cimex lectularius]|uniref:Ensconsin-like n=1 Tax=Cimex lectularius TaxID=79782 RepID=A0A8I6RTS4_CIMLE|nr:MAP7 domain-containing protein 1-like isoform X5 [Cimex lectularius]